MSRIHDALKKAAQERSGRTVGGSETDILESAAERSASVATEQLLDGQAIRSGPGIATTANPDFDLLVQRCTQAEWNFTAQANLFEQSGEGRLGAERFRTLRSRLYQIAETRSLKSIVVTSSVPAEGKTFVVTNLAHSIARQMERRVILIDADLRAPRLHQVLGAPKGPGLSDYLRGKVDECAAIQRGKDPNLFLIPAGSDVDEPSELLLNERMGLLVGRLTKMFDWVILDSPPVLPVHDATVIATHCDGVLFVVKAGETDFQLADKAAAEFREKNLLGVVLNQVGTSDSGGYYYYYGSKND